MAPLSKSHHTIRKSFLGTGPKVSDELGNWVISPSFPQDTSKPRLNVICLPYAGAGASIFREWQDRVPPGVRVVPVQLPGRENRWSEPAYVDMGLLVSKLVSVLCPLFEIPYVLFGHSMGGLICFECAQQIQRRNMAPPAHLFISGTRAPHIDNRELPLHILSDAEFLNELFARSGELSNLSSQNRELTKVLLPTIRADFTLCETFRSLSSEPLALPISVYGGKQDQLVVYNDLLSWNLYTRRSFKLQMFSGDHFFIIRERNSFLSALSGELSAITAKLTNIKD